ncbi:MAG: hypothetical protein ACLFN8_01160 [Candidatus Woesearchaeota archaeon]
MFSFKSVIEYDDRKIVADIHTANDGVSRESTSAAMAMLIDLDQSLSKEGLQKDLYTMIQAHGNNGDLYEHQKVLMSKDYASKQYDIICACNPEFWFPNSSASVLAFAEGNIYSHEILLNPAMQDINFFASIKGKGNFIMADDVKKRLDIGGRCYQFSDDFLRYESHGIVKLKMFDVWNFSK